MPYLDIPDEPPSGRLLPTQERRERYQQLETMHQLAEPRRKKRVDAREVPASTAERMRGALGDFHEYD